VKANTDMTMPPFSLFRSARAHAFIIGLALQCLLGLCGSADAQTGGIRGEVTDAAGSPAQDVEIVLNGNGYTRTAKTDAAGNYRFSGLPPGPYDLVAQRRGFRRTTMPVRVTVGDGPENREAIQSFSLEDSPPAKEGRFWGGFNRYSMGSFNEYLASGANEQIVGGFSAGAEISLVETKAPLVGGSVRLPIGVEYLSANSTTAHAAATGSATVNWDLPAVGVFVGTTLSFGPAERFYIHPGVGYYFVGRWKSAALSVTDRPGRLEVRGSSPGVFVGIGVNQHIGRVGAMFFESGYRYLEFTRIDAVPVDNFPVSVGGTVVQSGVLNTPIEFSSFLLRAGFTIRMGAKD
jgi:hypothetical protein